MSIRLLTAQDGTAFQALRLESLQTSPGSFLTTWDTESSKHENLFAAEIDAAYHPPHFGYYGIFSDDEAQSLLGYCLITKSYLDKQQHLAQLFALYITPAARRQGLAQTLLGHIVKNLKTHDHLERIFLTCLAHNKSALKFYRNLGFKRCGIRPKSVKWQGQYEDEIELVKVL